MSVAEQLFIFKSTLGLSGGTAYSCPLPISYYIAGLFHLGFLEVLHILWQLTLGL